MENAYILESILRRCGDILLGLFRSGCNKGEWIGSQYKSIADKIAHEFLIESLSSAFPGTPLVSEEDSVVGCDDFDEYFLLDPIDGTASFAEGYSGWVTQISYLRFGKPVVSAIYAPVTNDFYHAQIGTGAYKNGVRLNLNASVSRPTSIVDNYPKPRGITLNAMNELKIQNYYESGSISLKICLVAEGVSDIFIKDMKPRDWDLAPPMLLLSEAGGLITDLDGNPFRMGNHNREQNGIIACKNQLIHSQVFEWLKAR